MQRDLREIQSSLHTPFPWQPTIYPLLLQRPTQTETFRMKGGKSVYWSKEPATQLLRRGPSWITKPRVVDQMGRGAQLGGGETQQPAHGLCFSSFNCSLIAVISCLQHPTAPDW